SVSLAARRGIIVKDPAVLETIDTCRTAIFDKTGTLTYGRPRLVLTLPGRDFQADRVLNLVASVERYSKHPLASALVEAAREQNLPLRDASSIQEPPGQGLIGLVDGRTVEITSRKTLLSRQPDLEPALPPPTEGLECVALFDGHYAATFQFRDQPRAEGGKFVHHLKPKHHFEKIMIVSGDRASEVRYLANQVGISEIFADQSPEQKLALVREETKKARTLYLGDGINDAPALTVATVGLAFGRNSDITAEAAGAVILENTLEKVDEFLHISHRMRSIALESALGGMFLSLIGIVAAAFGYLPPVAGAIVQEIIDVIAVLNALRVAMPPRSLSDY
ncbi:MAG TPA: HAD-IC family P-type ATPase, partial [Isosphaeraceae bacterium]|nr:HAD-IC family P-type ATPase [Isosphaeraceae bacterium]